MDDDTLNPKVASSALDFLLIELVPLVQRVTDQLQAREQALMDEYRKSKIFNRPSNRDSLQSQSEAGTIAQSTVVADGERQKDRAGASGEGNMTVLGFPSITPSHQESMLYRLDSIGYRVGQGLVER